MELVINTFGVSLNRDNNAFVVTNKDGRQRIPAHSVTSIQIGRGVQITSDAIMLAVEHEIDMLFVDKAGVPQGRVWSPKYGSISTIRKGQLSFTLSRDALVWIKEVIVRKIENQQALLLMMQSEDSHAMLNAQKAKERLEVYSQKIKEAEGWMVADIAQSLPSICCGRDAFAYRDQYFLPISRLRRWRRYVRTLPKCRHAMTTTTVFLSSRYPPTTSRQ